MISVVEKKDGLATSNIGSLAKSRLAPGEPRLPYGVAAGAGGPPWPALLAPVALRFNWLNF